MSQSISVIICPKEELGFDSASIREKFNALAPVLAKHSFTQEQYLDSIDIATGHMPDDHFEQLKNELDGQGFALDTSKTLYALVQTRD